MILNKKKWQCRGYKKVRKKKQKKILKLSKRQFNNNIKKIIINSQKNKI